MDIICIYKRSLQNFTKQYVFALSPIVTLILLTEKKLFCRYLQVLQVQTFEILRVLHFIMGPLI